MSGRRFVLVSLLQACLAVNTQVPFSSAVALQWGKKYRILLIQGWGESCAFIVMGRNEVKGSIWDRQLEKKLKLTSTNYNPVPNMALDCLSTESFLWGFAFIFFLPMATCMRDWFQTEEMMERGGGRKKLERNFLSGFLLSLIKHRLLFLQVQFIVPI